MATKRSSRMLSAYEETRAVGVLATMLEKGFQLNMTPAEMMAAARGPEGLVDSVDLARLAIERDAVPGLCVQRQVDARGAVETVSLCDMMRPDDYHLYLAPLGLENKAR